MLEEGFRPAQVDAVVQLTDALEIRDDALYISDDDANYRTEVFTHVFDTLTEERNFDGWEPVTGGTYGAIGSLGWGATREQSR